VPVQVALQARAVREQIRGFVTSSRPVSRAWIAVVVTWSRTRSSSLSFPPSCNCRIASAVKVLETAADAVERLRRRRRFRAHLGVAEGLCPDGPTAVDDRKRHAGDMLLHERMRGPRIEKGKRLAIAFVMDSTL